MSLHKAGTAQWILPLVLVAALIVSCQDAEDPSSGADVGVRVDTHQTVDSADAGVTPEDTQTADTPGPADTQGPEDTLAPNDTGTAPSDSSQPDTQPTDDEGATPNDGDAPDADPLPDEGAAPDTTPAPALPCSSDDDCPDSLCLPTSEGIFCGQACTDECPDNQICTSIESEGVPMDLCVDPNAHLCQPCTEHSDCQGPGGADLDLCVPFEDGAGSFCGKDCSGGKGCPSGYLCVVLGTPLSAYQCVPI